MGKLKSGDEVIVQGNTYIASVLAITENDLVPVLIEPDSNTFNLNANNIELQFLIKLGLFCLYIFMVKSLL
jgi:dTDP-4-amino-4,6-dideoxygalactose transaminase